MSNYYGDSGYDYVKRESERMMDFRHAARKRAEDARAVIVVTVSALFAIACLATWLLLR